MRTRAASCIGTGVLVGTPSYMAPEQVRGEHEIGPSADVWALGCVLHECLTGQPVFAGAQMMAVFYKIHEDGPAWVCTRRRTPRSRQPWSAPSTSPYRPSRTTRD
jgi:serine/threonine protein kinase